MKSIVFNIVFLVGVISEAATQEMKPKVEGWQRIVPEQKFTNKDSVFSVRGDSLFKKYQTIPIDIPNVYGKRRENNLSVRMPIVQLSGKGLAPMPGTEKLNVKEVEKK